MFGIAQNREEDRNNVALAARTVIEMALCECPRTGGRPLSRWALDRLLAAAALLLEVATDSDAIYGELVQPSIKLWANGEYTIERDFYAAVIQPFVAAYFREGFGQAAKRYSELYRDRSLDERRQFDEVFSPHFRDAFNAEFHLTPNEAADGLFGLVELAVDQETTVGETTIGEIRRRLSEHGLRAGACSAFISSFTLFHRAAWDEVPAGFKRRDLSPWRYGRRLSVTVRPLLAFGENDSAAVLYGLGTLRQGFMYLLDRTERGQMPGEFFATEGMKTYLGKVSHERGHAFVESVAEAFRREDWQVRTSVKMSELGAPAELGDIDVLAWKVGRGVEVVECKRLQLARTVAEIAEICSRFRGDAKDELSRHLRRVEWIKTNLASVNRIVGFSVLDSQIDARVITNTHVPMRYLESLPIQADKIGPLRRLVNGEKEESSFS